MSHYGQNPPGPGYGPGSGPGLGGGPGQIPEWITLRLASAMSPVKGGPGRDLDRVLDNWSGLSHKMTMRGTDLDNADCPTWCNPEDWRRLAAYRLLAAYIGNVARFYLQGDRNDFREYGDAGLLVAQVVAAVLGDKQTIVVDGAAAYDPDQPEQDAPDPADPGAGRPGQIEGRTEWTAQEWLRSWADNERLPIRLYENEDNAVGLGDGVLTLTWDAAKQRPRVTVYDPGFYFPEVNDDDPAGYPDRVHMLWEYQDDDGVTWLRRRTWELAEILPATEVAVEDGRLRRIVNWLYDLVNPSPPPLQDGDHIDPASGRIMRTYPWATEPSPITCTFTDATWRLDDLGADWKWNRLPESKAQYNYTSDGELADHLDLRIDFLPVVHTPNTPAGAKVWGSSVITGVAQLLDDLSENDTDIAGASALAGLPPVAVSGNTASATGKMTYRKGEVWFLGPGGRLDALNISAQLKALMEVGDRLRDRTSVNARIPKAVLGNVDPSQIASGILLALTFAPYKALIEAMRLIRSEKDALLLKFALRYAQAAGQLAQGETPRAELRRGSYLPDDREAVVTEVVALVGGRIITVEYALRRLQEAGVVDGDVDVVAMATEIRHTDYQAAVALFEATGDTAAVRDLLGLSAETTAPAPPPIVLPGDPTPGDPTPGDPSAPPAGGS